MGSEQLTHWTSETVCCSEIAGHPQGTPQQLDQGSIQSLCCKEEEDLQGVEWNWARQCVITAAFHIVGTKPSEASYWQRRAQGKASDHSCWGHQCSKTALTEETQSHCEFVHPQVANRWSPRWEANDLPTGPVRLCVGVKLQGLHNIVYRCIGQPPSAQQVMTL